MVPVAVEPLVMPFTCQVTLVLAVLATVAVNCVVAPRRVSAAPEMVTVIAGGVVPTPVGPKLLPEHPARARRVQRAIGEGANRDTRTRLITGRLLQGPKTSG